MLRASQAAYFVAVVVTQMMNGVICKTRYNSLYHVGEYLPLGQNKSVLYLTEALLMEWVSLNSFFIGTKIIDLRKYLNLV